MFVLCPHCQFLVALDPVSGQPPLRCPRCQDLLQAAPVDTVDKPAESAVVTGQDPLEASTDSEMPGAVSTTSGDRPDEDPLPGDEPIANTAITDAPGGDATTNETATDQTAPTGQPVGEEPIMATEAVTMVTAAETAAANTLVASILAEALSAGDQDDSVQDDDADQSVESTGAFDADSIIEAMLGPAAIEVEAATATPAHEPVEPSAGTPVASERTANPTPPETTAESPPEMASSDLAPIVTDALEEPVAEPDSAGEAGAPDTAPPPVIPPGKPAPSFVRRPAAASGVAPHRRWPMIVAIPALTLSLVLQLLLADRAQLAADARWRPAMSSLCSALRCTLPPWHELAALTLLQRDVRPHPTIRGALQVAATFRNDARWSQPWPGVLLTLSDVDGRTVAARTFLPRDYLDTKSTTAKSTATSLSSKVAKPTQTMLASGQSKTIELDIVEPTPRIVAFTFDFQ